MTDEEEALLVDQVASAHRAAPRAYEDLRYHPAWHDLPEAARERAALRGRALRTLEAALDPDGLSAAARAVLARIG